ncbi:biotin/lipoyl-binding protein [Burkholderia thailandensis]|uniref:Efflux transporter, RND family, MFP subunit n=1 Tax=Burkholderia thailandensis (strain ATCC 700388 / DSM 13276 / CCUG 48851 / CIP 106301 / E264) TaxID=271848 RepID=Q2T4U1_BURTA|nr:biotin/lipoyl-binding protein [Burkholderia thailandensis]ABC34248.1 efflux transporter, RND family, MFP subunit [Burkholderia thailandensis E264]KVG15105.1 RND transporter [Burkholderia thailandensis]MCS3397326.1 biotin/lipoyl-binding protein [Burkholderia thailandensis]MCS6469929.1 biotin/lipoyl-binding protein [Burkholderia thailandensis]MCS6506596.1 biotin/lipoyl-binding protein [Burkholderia thailandensis]
MSGYLQRAAYEEGDALAQGAVLLVIDPRPYRIALDKANAQLRRARAAAGLAQARLARGRARTCARPRPPSPERAGALRRQAEIGAAAGLANHRRPRTTAVRRTSRRRLRDSSQKFI